LTNGEEYHFGRSQPPSSVKRTARVGCDDVELLFQLSR